MRKLIIEKQLPLPSPRILLKMCPSLPPPPPLKGQMSGEKADYCQRLEAVTGVLGERDPILSYSQPGGSQVIPSR